MDMEEMIEFIASGSKYYAELVTEAILTRAGQLLAQPHQGRAIPELQNPSKREVFEYNHRIMYSVSELPDIRILRVFHMARDFKKIT